MSAYKVLVPLDGSRVAEQALAVLPALTHLGELNVTLLSVVDFTEDVARLLPSEDMQREHNLLATYQEQVASDLEKHLKARVKREVLWGDSAEYILNQAEHDDPDVLVISTHGRSGFARWRRGSVADKVIRDAKCPVLVVGPKAAEAVQWLEAVPPFKHILVPLDGSDVAEQALPVAKAWAEAFGSQVHLLRVMPFSPLASGFVNTPDVVEAQVRQAGETYLAGVVGQAGGNSVTSVAIGTPAGAIDEYISANNIDLVVMTTYARRGLARAALGSVTDRIIGSGPPVIVVRPAGR